jgi:hypothetical protein
MFLKLVSKIYHQSTTQILAQQMKTPFKILNNKAKCLLCKVIKIMGVHVGNDRHIKK